MNTVREKILTYLEHFAEDEASLVTTLDKLAAEEGLSVYQHLFQILCSLDFSPELAADFWRKIISNYRELNRALKRQVSLRTATCDYFCSVSKSLRNCKLIEIDLYERTVKLSQYDDLTGLHNRRIFFESLKVELSRSERYGCDLSILLFDLDDFKQVNDTYGHIIGDKVLKATAAVILKNIRNQDIAARYGGEEIALMLPETSKRNALIIGERIRREIEKLSLKQNGSVIKVTVSGGLASYPYDATSGANLLKDADTALYRAKTAGKNFISLFSQNKRRHIRVALRNDIMVGEMKLDGTVMYPAKCENISGGGLLFETRTPHEVGAKIQAKICLRPDTPFLLAGKVVRLIRKAPELYDVGLSLLDIDKNVNQNIFAFILHHIEQSPSGTIT